MDIALKRISDELYHLRFMYKKVAKIAIPKRVRCAYCYARIGIDERSCPVCGATVTKDVA